MRSPNTFAAARGPLLSTHAHAFGTVRSVVAKRTVTVAAEVVVVDDAIGAIKGEGQVEEEEEEEKKRDEDEEDHFRLFGLEPRFDLDLDALAGGYRGLLRRLHPDLHGEKPEEERAALAAAAARANHACSVLKNPYQRVSVAWRACVRA